MKKLIILLVSMLFFANFSYAIESEAASSELSHDQKSVQKLLKSQVKYANKTNLKKFMSTYDISYKNSDGFNYATLSDIVKDVWNSYNNITYGLEIKKITVDGENATAEVKETSYAPLPAENPYSGEMNTTSESIYYLKRVNGKWKVISDKVLDEITTMLYGQAKGLDVKVTAPETVEAGNDYLARLEFTPPAGVIAIGSLASEVIAYPQKQPKDVFRALPEDNVLERFFTANKDNANEYIVAAIGLTQADVCDLSIKLSFLGYGYAIRRVNVTPNTENTAEKAQANVEGK